MVYEKRNNRSSKGWWRNFFLIFSGRVILSFFVSLSFFMSLNVILLKEGEDKIFCVGLLFHITQSDSEESYFFVILTLSRSPEPKPWAEALSRSPEPKPWAYAKGQRRVCEGAAKGQRRVSEGSAKGKNLILNFSSMSNNAKNPVHRRKNFSCKINKFLLKL